MAIGVGPCYRPALGTTVVNGIKVIRGHAYEMRTRCARRGSAVNSVTQGVGRCRLGERSRSGLLCESASSLTKGSWTGVRQSLLEIFQLAREETSEGEGSAS